MADSSTTHLSPQTAQALRDWTDQFLDPRGGNQPEVAQLLRQVVDLLIEELSRAASTPPVPLEWDEIPSNLLVPAGAVSSEEILKACRSLVRGSMNPAHPRYLGHMDPLPSTGSVIGSLLMAAVNNNMLSREMSPIFSELEQRLSREMAGMFGLPETACGMMQSGGTLCNIQALAVARNHQFREQGIARHGIQSMFGQPVILASDLCHTSIQKAAMLLGLGSDAVIPIPTDEHCRLSPNHLRRAILECRLKQQLPFAVVGTLGTTVTGSIDPLPELATICEQEDLWFHVDASYGGAVIFSDKYRHLRQGCEQADSITFNPQKWCYVTKACAMVFFRDESVLDHAFRIPAPYMSLNEESGSTNLGEWGVQGTRAPDVAKWWLTLLQFGQSGLGALVDQTLQLTQEFVARLSERPYLELATRPDLNILCFRDLRNSERPDEYNAALQRQLLEEHQTFFSLPWFRKSRWLKAVLLNPYTTTTDLDSIFEFIDRFQHK